MGGRKKERGDQKLEEENEKRKEKDWRGKN